MIRRQNRSGSGQRSTIAAIGVAGVVAAIGLVGGCAAKNPDLWTGPANGGGGADGVFRTPEVQAYDASSVAVADVARFEFSRRDASLNPVSYGPLVAANQWPQAPKPAERRIQFWMWIQR